MPASWLNASMAPVVPGTRVHAMAATPLFLWLVWWSVWTLALLFVVSIVCAYLQIKGRHPVWVIRRAKSRLRGHFVHARPLWYRRRRTRLDSYADIRIDETYALDGPVAAPQEGSRAHALRPGGRGSASKVSKVSKRAAPAASSRGRVAG